MIQHYPLDMFKVTAFQKMKAGNDCCGDSFLVKQTEDFLLCAVVDGLGSGPKARDASTQATAVMDQWCGADLDTIISQVNHAMSGFRGSVASAIKVYPNTNQLFFCGIGNITVKIYSPANTNRATQPLPTKGFLSGRPVHTKIQEHPFPNQSAFLIHSDGLKYQPHAVMAWYQERTHQELTDQINEENLKQNVLSTESNKDDTTVIIGQRL